MTSSERWLITGACGQLGGHVSALLRDRGANTLGLSRRRCAGDHGQVLKTDVTCRDALDRILAEFEPTHIVHTAGIAAPARAQHQQAAAWQIHVAVTQHLAAFAAATGGWLLYPSTDFVWDGHAEGRYRETDSPRPGTYYEPYRASQRSGHTRRRYRDDGRTTSAVDYWQPQADTSGRVRAAAREGSSCSGGSGPCCSRFRC